QEDAVADASDSISASIGVGLERTRWLALAVCLSADSRRACRSATEDLHERVVELVHVHQPRAAAPRSTAAHATGKRGAGKAGSLRRSWKAAPHNGGAWARSCSDTSAKRSLSHFCCHSTSLR